MHAPRSATLTLLMSLVALAACGGGGDPPTGRTPNESASPAPTPASGPTPTTPPVGITVRGTAHGLAGQGLAASLNGGTALTVSADGTFAFPGTLPQGTAVQVTITRQPTTPTQICTVGTPQPVDAGAAVFVRIDCTTPPPTLTGTLAMKSLRLSWPALPGSTRYQVERQIAGGAWTADGTDIAAPTTTATRELSAHLADWVTTRYRVRGCAGEACSTTAELALLDLAATAGGYLKASNSEAADVFGTTIALSGDGSTLAIGAPGEDGGAGGVGASQTSNTRDSAGAVYVFRRDGTGWTQQAYLKAATPAAGARFGESLALSRDGNTLAVGAPGFDTHDLQRLPILPSTAPRGAVHVFARAAAGTWSAPVLITAANGEAGDGFGASVSLDSGGTLLAVGAPGEDGNAAARPDTNDTNASGAAYVFTRSGTTWTQRDYVKATAPALLDNFGRVVALSGDGTTLAVAAPLDSAGTAGAGSVSVFTRGTSSWVRQAYLRAPPVNGALFDDLFGRSLALSRDGSTLAVGAALEDGQTSGVGGSAAQRGSATADSGAVHVFGRSGSTWRTAAYLKAPATFSGDRFGSSVALSADGATLAAGAPLDDGSATGIGSAQVRGRADSGGVTVYVRRDGTWEIRNHVKAPQPGVGDQFGTAVALSDDGAVLAVGAPREDGSGIGTTADPASDAAADAGATYVY